MRVHLKHKHMHYTSSTRKFISFLPSIVLVIAIIFVLWGQSRLVLTKEFILESNEIPKAFVGYRIVHIADLSNTTHNCVKAIRKAKPNVIVISGGYSDDKGRFTNTVNTVNKLVKIAPVYYIYNRNDNKSELSGTQAVNIENSGIELTPDQLSLKAFLEKNYSAGIVKNAAKGDQNAKEYLKYIEQSLNNTLDSTIILGGLSSDTDRSDIEDTVYKIIGYDLDKETILLNGNIDNLEQLSKTAVDTIMFGGTYGVNLISDTYSKGQYGLNGATLFVTGGVGNNKDVKRILNYPEIQLIILSDGSLKQYNPIEEIMSSVFSNVGDIYENDGGFQLIKKSYKLHKDGQITSSSNEESK